MSNTVVSDTQGSHRAARGARRGTETRGAAETGRTSETRGAAEAGRTFEAGRVAETSHAVQEPWSSGSGSGGGRGGSSGGGGGSAGSGGDGGGERRHGDSGRRGGPRPRGAQGSYWPELRRLLPRAVVVAFLAGGTSAFLVGDKAVELSTRGVPRTTHTLAGDAAEPLTGDRAAVGAHDIAAPAPGAGLVSGDASGEASGEASGVRYGRSVLLTLETLDGHRRRVLTTARAVDGAPRRTGVRADMRAERALASRVDRGGRIIRTNATNANATNATAVDEALTEDGLAPYEDDATSLPDNSAPDNSAPDNSAPDNSAPDDSSSHDGSPYDGRVIDGRIVDGQIVDGQIVEDQIVDDQVVDHQVVDDQTIGFQHITSREQVRDEAIPYDTVRTEDPTLFRGTEVIDQRGRPGLRRVTYGLRTVDGVQQEPRVLHEEVIRAPVTRRVRVGTKARPTSTASVDHLNWKGLAACESSGRPNAVDPSGKYGGLYQFDAATWRSVGGQGRPQDATAEEQTYRAKKLYMQRGASPWPYCGRRLTG
ncbi:G5 domain-containing protein [Streptomyces sp. NPDC056909]|uniref:G5 domain-containing protein n=1 Tax=Streptomyces sp. NPDC056909 TaxID=3345963 RepID=UPI0036CFE232